jgi:hypothetical protein
MTRERVNDNGFGRRLCHGQEKPTDSGPPRFGLRAWQDKPSG